MKSANKSTTIELSSAIPRLHRFPPLRKARPQSEAENSITGLEYQQQLNDGFQHGVSEGFAKGLLEGRQNGFAQGSSEGFAEGLVKGRIDAQQIEKQIFDNAARPLSLLTDSVNQALEHYETRRREELLQLVEKVTYQVIRCELALQPTQLLALIDEALSGMEPRPTRMKITMNPQEYQRIVDVEPEKAAQWGLMPEPDMPLGECRIITDNAELDVGCKHRLDQCINGLRTSLLPEKNNE